jgi:hypothetical protein
MRLLPLLLVVSLTHAIAEPAKKEMPAADVSKWLGFFDKLVTVVAKPAPTCDQLAVDVAVVLDDNKPVIEIARNARATGQKLPEAAQQHMLEGVKKMLPAIQKCGQHEKVRAAFAKLDLNRKG